jgi:hypothetical protein
MPDADHELGVQLQILQERDATLHREMIDLLTSPRMMTILGRQRTQKALRWFQNRRPANHHPPLAPTAYCKTGSGRTKLTTKATPRMSEQQRKVETVEDFKVRIAAMIRAKPEEIPAPPRPHKRVTNRKAKRRTTR